MGDIEIPSALRSRLNSADPIIKDQAQAELFELQAAAAAAEQVDHPAHYGGADNPYETIKVLEAWLTPDQMIGFCLGNAIKYISRAGKKADPMYQDLKKAQWYTDYATGLALKQDQAKAEQDSALARLRSASMER